MADMIRYMTPIFRASFPNLFTASSGPDGGEPKYGLSAIWTPGNFTEKEAELWKKLMAGVDGACKEQFKKSLKELKALNAEGGNYKLVPRNGSSKAHLGGYGEGTVFASLTTRMKPGVVDADRSRISVEDGNEDLIYPGCYCRATVNVYTYDNKGKGVALGLLNVQKVKDGERLDSRTDAAEDFSDDFLGDTSDFLDD